MIGTFATAGIVAAAAHYVLGFSWIEAGLIGAAIAPTDPAVTFSVFGNREIRGRSGTILEGEAGVNDPVGIALMIGIIELAEEDDGGLGIVAASSSWRWRSGSSSGSPGALLLLPVMRHVRLTAPALYPIRVLAGAGIIYGLASVAGGSGFLAVFVAGIILGDVAAPRKGEIETFHSSLAGLAEIAAFIALGLSISLGDIGELGVWGDGLALALILAFVARPLAVLPFLLPARLHWRERIFIAWSGLKGAVPILLGALAVLAQVDSATKIYGIVFVVVLFSVIVQGASIPYVARRLRIPFRRIDYDLAEVLEFVVRDDAFASGKRLGELPLGERAWVGVLIRDGRPHTIGDDVVLQPGDHVHVYCQPEDAAALARIFAGRSVVVHVEAAAALAAEQACVLHRHDPRRRRHARLAELLVERLGRVHVHVDPDEVDQRARPHRPAGAGGHRGVEVLRRDARLVEHPQAVVQQRDEDAVDDEAGRVVTADRLLAHPLADLERGLDRLVGGELGSHDLDERHQRRRVEEVHSHDPLGRRDRGRDLGHGERRRVRREDRVRPDDALELLRRAPSSASSSSTIASITRSQSANA